MHAKDLDIHRAQGRDKLDEKRKSSGSIRCLPSSFLHEYLLFLSAVHHPLARVLRGLHLSSYLFCSDAVGESAVLPRHNHSLLRSFRRSMLPCRCLWRCACAAVQEVLPVLCLLPRKAVYHMYGLRECLPARIKSAARCALI
jgi:hypothetical protein